MASDTVEFALGWKRSLASLGLVLPTPVLYMILFPTMMPDTYEVRWSGVLLLVPVVVAVLAYQSGARTVLTREGIMAREVGRPWRMLGRTMIPWHEVVAIDARKLGRVYLPVVHLTGGRTVRLRVPFERSHAKLADDLATIQRWQIENTGTDPAKIVVPARLAGPGRRRRLLVPLGAIAVTTLGVVGMGVAWAVEWDEPPEVLNCPLVPPDLAQRIMPGASPKPLGAGDPGDSCQWLRPAHKGLTDGGSLLVPDVVQIQHPRLVDPQAHVGGQPGDGVVAGRRGELAAGGKVLAPPGEQLLDLGLRRRDPQQRVD